MIIQVFQRGNLDKILFQFFTADFFTVSPSAYCVYNRLVFLKNRTVCLLLFIIVKHIRLLTQDNPK